MVYSLAYRRPAYRGTSRSSISSEQKQESIHESITSGSSGMSHGVPEQLSFDRIIAGGVCPPCTVRDFMNYLKYIELSPENLQFFLWHKDYVKRFDDLPDGQKKLSPEWSSQRADGAVQVASTPQPVAHVVSPEAAAVFKGTDFETKPKIAEGEKGNPFHTPPRTPSGNSSRDGSKSLDHSTFTSDSSYIRKAHSAFQDAGLKWQPFTAQPYRAEVARIIGIYIAEGAPRELNLSARERASLLHALTHTTHPSAFRSVLTSVEWSLRCQSHPNFIRWTICNGNRARVVFARGLGIGGIVAGIVTAILITLSSAGRAWRVLSFIGFMIGTATLIAAWKGMCVVLHGMHHRHLRPWELFVEGDEISGVELKNDSAESAESSNSFEDEPWVAKYEKRNLIRKVFDREVWIEEQALRQIQDTIFLQAMLGAFVISAIAVGIFCAVPKGNFY